MKAGLVVATLLLGVVVLSSASIAATYVYPVPGLAGDYKWPDGVAVPMPPYDFNSLKIYASVAGTPGNLAKMATVNPLVQFQSVGAVRLHLVGAVTQRAMGTAPTYFLLSGAATFPPANGAFDQTMALTGDFSSLLGSQGSLSLNLGLSFDTMAYVVLADPWAPPIVPPAGTISAAFLEIDGQAVPGTLVGDVDADGAVNLSDLKALVTAWGTTSASPSWNAAADLDSDGAVGLGDLKLLVANWGNPR